MVICVSPVLGILELIHRSRGAPSRLIRVAVAALVLPASAALTFPVRADERIAVPPDCASEESRRARGAEWEKEWCGSVLPAPPIRIVDQTFGAPYCAITSRGYAFCSYPDLAACKKNRQAWECLSREETDRKALERALEAAPRPR